MYVFNVYVYRRDSLSDVRTVRNFYDRSTIRFRPSSGMGIIFIRIIIHTRVVVQGTADDRKDCSCAGMKSFAKIEMGGSR